MVNFKNKSYRKIWIFLILFLFLNLTIINNSNICLGKTNKTLYVGGSGDQNYSSIQSAIDNADDKDKIIVINGIYKENIILNKSINILGLGNPIIDGESKSYGLYLEKNNINISGFVIKNSKTGIFISNPYEEGMININNNYLYNNTASIYIENNNYICNINNNFFSDNSEAVRMYNSSNNLILNNVFLDHSSYAIFLWEQSNNNNISGNVFNFTNGIVIKRWSNDNMIYNNFFYDGSIWIKHSYSNDIIANELSGCGKSIVVEKSKYNNISFNKIDNCEIGIYIINSEENDFSSNFFSNNDQDIKERQKLPGFKTPGFEFLLLVFILLVFLLFKKKKIFT